MWNIEYFPTWEPVALAEKDVWSDTVGDGNPCSAKEGYSGMSAALDDLDRKILSELQTDAEQSLDEIARKVGSSKTPVWNRIRRMREQGVITRTTAILDPEALGLEACFFVLIRTSEHEAEWQRKFLKALRERPEVLEAHRLAGDIDYILKVRVKNARAYDTFYQALISEVRIYNVTALLSMEEIKSTTVLPL